MKSKYSFVHNGQSLVEVVVTLGVVILFMTGLVIGTTASLRSAQSSKARALSSQYAQEAIEILRKERDNGWSVFIKKSGYYCVGPTGNLESVVSETTACEQLVGGLFDRKVFLTPSGDTMSNGEKSEMKIDSLVFWTEGSSKKSVKLQTVLTAWR